MKLQTELYPKPEDQHILSGKMSDEPTSEEAVSKAFSHSEPNLSIKLVDAAKNTVTSIWEWKKDKCCLMPQNCCLLSDKCCLTKLRCVRQLKDELVPKETKA